MCCCLKYWLWHQVSTAVEGQKEKGKRWQTLWTKLNKRAALIRAPSTCIPAFNGLPKVHKPEPNPVRPIISSIGSVTYNFKHAAKLIGSLVGNSPHHLTNAQEFVGKVQNLKLVDDEITPLYDVTALFMCIPSDDAIQVVREYLEKDGTLSERTDLSVNQIVELITICLNTTYFSYSNKFFFFTRTWLFYGLCGFSHYCQFTWRDLNWKFWEITLVLRLNCGFAMSTTHSL